MSAEKIYFWLERFFWKTLCPRPDGRFNCRLNGWPYRITGKIAGYFHRKTCTRCAGGSND